jgi:hypothetical protein
MLNYCRRRPAFQPVQFVCLRCMGPLLTVVTALASWMTDQTQEMVVVMLHSPMFWVYVFNDMEDFLNKW